MEAGEIVLILHVADPGSIPDKALYMVSEH